MPHPKKKPRLMQYFLIINKETGDYFINKSTHPAASVRHQFSRANRPERKDYDCEFYQAIRALGPEGFDVSYSIEPPEWMARRAHYVKAVDDAPLQYIANRTEESNTPFEPESQA